MENTAYQQFEEWLKKQPFWLQDSAWRIYNKKVIDDQQISIYLQMCIDEVQKRQVIYKTIDRQMVLPSKLKPKMTINGITRVTNVNALADNTELLFGNDGVSVVYGLNGAGKSGFMRIFKHVTRNPYAEAIQQNVYKKGNGKKTSCVFDISDESGTESIECDLSANCTDARLSQCDVFDTRISGAYITSSNSVSYEPFVFSALKELADVAGRIEFLVKAKIEDIPEPVMALPDEIKNYESAAWLSNITGNTVIPNECQKWNNEDENRITEIIRLLDAKQVENELKGLKNQKNQLQNVVLDLKRLQQALLGSTRDELVEAYKAYISQKEQYELSQKLFSENAYEQDKISVSVESWNKLWKYGKEYYEKCIHDGQFAKEGSICPLCLQEVNGDVLTRFSSVDEYINGSCNEAYQKAKEKFEEKYKKILEHKYSSDIVADLLDELIDDVDKNEIVVFYQTVENLESSDDKEKSYLELIALRKISAIEKLDTMLAELESKIAMLSESLNLEKRKELSNELLHAKYRKWVNSQIEIITAYVSNELKRTELISAKSLLKTNKISTESNTLAEQLITEAYIERFSDELKRLAPYLKVKLEKGQSSKGKSPYKVVLDTEDKARKHPQDILSEGEQRIVSLAAFFADASGRDELTPIIIDDPISSLDYNYEEAATKRIVELARTRQIIVFTHRISLLVGISEQCEKEGVAFCERHIRGTLIGKGVSDFEETYHGKIPAQLVGIQNRIRDTKKMDPYSHEYVDSCSRISQQLRICVERSVEDVLFQQMVKRFRRKIMTGKLMKMNQITETDCKIIDDMMTKYSFGEHSQPEDSGLITMDLDEVISDIDKFRVWIKEYNKKMG